MKCNSALPAVIAMGLTACDPMTGPVTSGDFDPLRPPGSGSNLSSAVGPAFSAGQFVRTSMDNVAFFRNRPKGDADADKLLPFGVSMKVISTSDSYVKVELDSGEVGYVPSLMLEDPNAASSIPVVNPNEYQVYPPVGDFAVPLPAVTPAEQPPGGAIPTVIDPEAPVAEPPPVTVPNSEVPPLPPNDEELKAEKTEATPQPEE